MMEIRLAALTDADIISKLASEIWPVAYAKVISKNQISLMLAQSYTVEAIQNQFNANHTFFMLLVDGLPQGFASVTQENETNFKLQKLYMHQNIHKNGAGKLMLNHVEEFCKTQGALKLILNVNRGNNAKFFYEKMGYQVTQFVDISYHQYVLNDYVMAKALAPS